MNKLQKRKQTIFLILALAVPVILLLMFVAYPMLDMVRMSFTDWDGLAPKKNFIGIKNYVDMFTKSPEVWQSLRNNLVYFIVHLLFIPIEIVLAVILDSKFRGAKFFKSAVFMPYIINGVAIAYAFSFFFSPINGGFDSILKALGLGGLIQNWLSAPGIVNVTLSSVSLWRYSGYHIVLFLAALQSVPTDILEAADIDGATAIQKFTRITLPSIALVVDFVLFSNVRGALQVFDIPFVMTKGGPGYASSTFSLLTIDTAFKFQAFGMASSMGVILMLLTVLLSFLQNKLMVGLRGGKNE